MRRRIPPCRNGPAIIIANMVVEPMMRYDCVRRVPEIHGRLPRRNRSAQSDGPLPDLKKECQPGKVKSRVVNSGAAIRMIDVRSATSVWEWRAFHLALLAGRGRICAERANSGESA